MGLQGLMVAWLTAASMQLGLTQNDFLSDGAWLELASQTAIGSRLCPLPSEVDAPRRLKALGFLPEGRASFCKEVDLSGPAALVHHVGADLSAIDAVVVMSIDRAPAERPYLYDTLRSLLRELPSTTVINVVLGDERDGFVARHRLEEILGAQGAARIHVVTTPVAIATFLRANYDLKARATWNYARILRSFAGAGHLLVLEDDVQLSGGMASALQRLLAAEHPPLVSLYNYECGRLPGADPLRMFDVGILSYPARAVDRSFARAQAIVYSASLAHALGNYLALRLGNDALDAMIGQYLRVSALDVGYVQPSMVQHVGFTPSGLGPFHESICYTPVYPPF